MEIAEIQGIIDTDPSLMDIQMLADIKLDLDAAMAAIAEIPEPPPEAEETIELLAIALGIMEAEQRRRLDKLAQMMSTEFEKAARARTDAENRMIADERQWDGRQRDWNDSKAYPSDSQATSLQDEHGNVIHATRSRQMLYAARLTDMMLPTNEVPFRVDPDENPDPTCVPSFVPPKPQQGEPGPDGQPTIIEPTEADIKAALDDANARAAGKMQDTIKDQLAEAGLSRHGRRCIDDATRIGVGLTGGPFMQYKRKVKVRMVDGSPEPSVEIETMTVPGYEYVNPYFFWYDMSEDLSKARKTFQLELYDRSRLMELKKYPNTIHSAIDELLADKDPTIPASVTASVNKRNQALGLIEPLSGRWAVFRTYAAIEPEKLKEIGGIDWEHKDVMPLIEMLWCNGKCIKWKLGEVDCGYRVPYYNLTPFPIDDTIYGASVCYLARAAQSNLDGAWSATLDNAAIASGPHLFLKKTAFQSQDGAMRMNGPKIYDWTDDGIGDIRSAMYSLLVNSNVEGNLLLVDKAQEFMDQDTLLPQILQGNVTSAEQTAAGQVQNINLATILQRTICARADDHWFQPMAEQWGLWNQLYNPDPELQGDFNYKGTASTALVSRDVQIQHTQVLTAMANDPRFSGFTDDFELWSANVKMLDIPNKDAVIKPRDKAMADHAAIQASQGDPLAQAKMAELELATKKLEQESQIRMAELQLERERMAQDAQIGMQELQMKLQIAQLDYQRALIEANARSSVDIAKVDAAADAAIRDNAAKSASEGAKLGLEATKIQQEGELAAAKLAQDGQRVKMAQNPSPDSALD